MITDVKKMKILKSLGLAFLVIALLDGILVIWRSSSEEFTHLSLKSEDGAQIRQRVHDNYYGTPIDGSYSISLPPGKYIATSNIREWLIIQVMFLAAGFACMVAYLRKEERLRQRTENVKES